ncbi:MAG: hypothetical protein OEY97_10955 [Nitrospirota bacterium]|nr:hypothetical protein [Nitrospirota bacterium]
MTWFSNMMSFLSRAEHTTGSVLSMNQRNLLYIYPHNPREHFDLSDDKIKAKAVLAASGVPVPESYKVYGSFFELRNLEADLSAFPSFVVKPAHGRGGGGILVIDGKDGDAWTTPGGRRHTLDDMRSHLSDIVFGIHSFGLADHAIIEERVIQHPEMQRISPLGLADVRLILFKGKPVLAMSRIPTQRSDGKANLHQGAVGAGIDLNDGRITRAILGGHPVDQHPDTGEQLVGFTVPFWRHVMEVGLRTARAVPLGYIGADIVITPQGPMVLEINVRPGLQIQNANGTGMRAILEGLGGMHTEWDEGRYTEGAD